MLIHRFFCHIMEISKLKSHHLHFLICRSKVETRHQEYIPDFDEARRQRESQSNLFFSRINDSKEKHATKREHKDRGKPGHSRVKSERRSCAAGRNAMIIGVRWSIDQADISCQAERTELHNVFPPSFPTSFARICIMHAYFFLGNGT